MKVNNVVGIKECKLVFKDGTEIDLKNISHLIMYETKNDDEGVQYEVLVNLLDKRRAEYLCTQGYVMADIIDKSIRHEVDIPTAANMAQEELGNFRKAGDKN